MAFEERTLTPEKEAEPKIAFGIYYPETVLTNKEIESWGVKTAGGNLLTAEQISRKTGIVQRFVAVDEDVFSMGMKAAKPLIDKFGGLFDFVIFTTTYPTGEHLSMKSSSFINSLPFNTLDVHVACSSFVYAFNYIREYQDWFDNRRVLIISSEKLSPTLVNLKNGQGDPSLSQTIFSDGAVAASFVYGHNLKILAIRNFQFNLEESWGLRMPVNYDLISDSKKVGKVASIWGPPSKTGKVEMKGRSVYEAVVRKIPGLITEVICAAGLNFQDIDLVIPHQASKQMLDGICKRLPPPLSEKMLYDLQDGNFSSASIPKAWMKAQNEGKIAAGSKIVLAGFGAGLYASTTIVAVY